MTKQQLAHLIAASIRKHGRNPEVLAVDLYKRLEHLAND